MAAVKLSRMLNSHSSLGNFFIQTQFPRTVSMVVFRMEQNVFPQNCLPVASIRSHRGSWNKKGNFCRGMCTSSPVYSTIEIGKEDMKFSAAHYTVFSATERERLHGHTHAVRVTITGPVGVDGMIANYALFKKRVRALCDEWDEYYLIPGCSPFVRVQEGGGRVLVTHNGLTQDLPEQDCMVLPVTNVTLEELSRLMLQRLVGEIDGRPSWADSHGLVHATVKVSSDGGRGQWASCIWRRGQGFGVPP